MHSGFNSTVEVLDFWNASIDEVAIAKFLKHTPCLKSLRYGHSTKDSEGYRDWDLCQFITAVQREVGNHLEKLSIAMERSCSIAPGKPSLRNFKQLQSLELPLDTVICGFTAAELADHETLYSESILGDIVPPSVSELSFVSHRKQHHDKALNLLFRDFATQKHTRTPLLKEILL